MKTLTSGCGDVNVSGCGCGDAGYTTVGGDGVGAVVSELCNIAVGVGISYDDANGRISDGGDGSCKKFQAFIFVLCSHYVLYNK